MFLPGELLDGQRGLVPSNFVDFVQDEEMPPVQPVDGSKEVGYLSHGSVGLPGLGGLLQDTKLDGPILGLGVGMSLADLPGTCSNGTGTLDVSIDEIGEDIVPYPRRITLIKQLAKSVIVAWEPPLVAPGWGNISTYNVLVDKEVRATVPFGARTKSLIEKLNLATCTYRVSVQCITERGPSDEMRCTLLVGKDVVVAPYCLRMDNITQASAELSWMPSNSNYSHSIFLNDAEYDIVKASNYRYQFFNLKPMMVYRVRLVAQPHQMPWQLPLEQREKKESSVEFCTQPAGKRPCTVFLLAAPSGCHTCHLLYFYWLRPLEDHRHLLLSFAMSTYHLAPLLFAYRSSARLSVILVLFPHLLLLYWITSLTFCSTTS